MKEMKFEEMIDEMRLKIIEDLENRIKNISPKVLICPFFDARFKSLYFYPKLTQDLIHNLINAELRSLTLKKSKDLPEENRDDLRMILGKPKKTKEIDEISFYINEFEEDVICDPLIWWKKTKKNIHYCHRWQGNTCVFKQVHLNRKVSFLT